MGKSVIKANLINSINFQQSFRNITVNAGAVIGDSFTIPKTGRYLIYYKSSIGGWFNNVVDTSSQDYHATTISIFTRHFTAGETFGFYNLNGSAQTSVYADIGYIMISSY